MRRILVFIFLKTGEIFWAVFLIGLVPYWIGSYFHKLNKWEMLFLADWVVGLGLCAIIGIAGYLCYILFLFFWNFVAFNWETAKKLTKEKSE